MEWRREILQKQNFVETSSHLQNFSFKPKAYTQLLSPYLFIYQWEITCK